MTVGSFDGVHLGHQAVLREIARRAAAAGRASVLVTFEPHPLEVVNPQAAPPLLTTGAERREILAQLAAGLRAVPAVRPAARGAHARGVRASRCCSSAAEHARAGHRARSRVRARPERRRRHPAPARRRARLRGGRGDAVDVRRAARLQLADPARGRRRRPGDRGADAGPALPGERRVGQGERRGRQLGVPTINLADVPPQKLLPPDGVYAVRVEWRGGRAGGMMNQGPRPTFAGRAADARGAPVRLRGRSVRRVGADRVGGAPARRGAFASVEALQQQLERDRPGRGRCWPRPAGSSR